VIEQVAERNFVTDAVVDPHVRNPAGVFVEKTLLVETSAVYLASLERDEQQELACSAEWSVEGQPAVAAVAANVAALTIVWARQRNSSALFGPSSPL
jgi:hypothetical protein